MIFLQGLLLGFSIAAPVGPIGALCIRRTLAQGPLAGFVSGMGAATADSMYGAIAGFGLTAISGWLLASQGWLQLVGGLFLCFLGVRTLLDEPAQQADTDRTRGLLGAYLSTFLLTVTNPATILSFVAVFAGLGLTAAGGDYASAGLLVGGVFLGSAFWWWLLSQLANRLRNRLQGGGLRWVNRLSGTMILGFGMVAIAGMLTGGQTPGL